MTKVNKNFTDIPNILTSTPSRGSSREIVFLNNISNANYVDEKNSYKTSSIQKKLTEIYHLKCAYCEKKLLDSPKHIEHYRPKNIYYWLAYSWDNLLLSCGSCNSVKSDNFEIQNTRVSYDNETFNNIHNLGNNYDSRESPLIINPEKDDILEDIKYDVQAKIDSDNVRVKHTIDEACNLNREELITLRLVLLNDFINSFNKHFNNYLKERGGLSRFEPDIEIFIEKCNTTEEFFSFRYFILNNIDVFFEEEPKRKILKAVISKFNG